MIKTKQVQESKAINFINTIIRSGRRITKVKYNGQPSTNRYVMVQWLEPKAL